MLPALAGVYAPLGGRSPDTLVRPLLTTRSGATLVRKVYGRDGSVFDMYDKSGRYRSARPFCRPTSSGFRSMVRWPEKLDYFVERFSFGNHPHSFKGLKSFGPLHAKFRCCKSLVLVESGRCKKIFQIRPRGVVRRQASWEREDECRDELSESGHLLSG